MASSADTFPRGLAVGEAFCNRVEERAKLGRRIRAGNHSWVAAPRRHGKTSLLHQTLIDLGRRRQSGQPHIRGVVVDMLPAYDRTGLQRFVLDAVGDLVGAMVPSHKRILEAANRFFADLRPRVTLSSGGPRLELASAAGEAATLTASLAALDEAAAAESTRAVVVLDEFQHVGELAGAAPFEAAIRHAVERARNTTYLFSGSHRHLLAQMFTDPDRPLYHLCEPFEIARIAADEYVDHLEAQARARWQAPPSRPALERILMLTERHPYYVNLLCARLWRDDTALDVEGVSAAWDALVGGDGGWLVSTLESLSKQQVAVLSGLAEAPTDSPTGREFLARCRVPKSSVAQALDVLLARDHVRRDGDGTLRVLDPAVRWYLVGRRSVVPGR